MSRAEMRHPDEVQLQVYLDGEIEAAKRPQLAAHLDHCPLCSARARRWEELAAALRATRPTPATFSTEGEFWARLARQLPDRRPPTWAFLAYLLPVLLGALGVVLDLLVSAVLVFYGLISLGVVPPLHTTIQGWLTQVRIDPFIADSVSTWASQSLGDRLVQLSEQWKAMALSQRDDVLLWAVLAVLGIALAAVVVLYFLWAICWSRSSEVDANGGRPSWNTVESSSGH
jgi:anti-sigma factor RsiW